jgi:hypothetical protein
VPQALYPRLLGVAWSELDASLQQMHCNGAPVRAVGALRICRGTNLWARILLLFVGLPRPAAAAEVELAIRPDGQSETWLRMFDGKPLVTVQREFPRGLLAERFGALEFQFRLDLADRTIHYRQVGVTLRLAPPFFSWGIPLPRWASPRVSAEETAGASEMETHIWVEVSAPLAGLLFSYEGRMTREEA